MDDYDKYFNQLQSSRRLTSKGVEYWSARDLQGFLRYSSWERLDGVIARARQACVRSGQPEANHFHKRVNMVTIGSGAERESADWLLTRYACYLIAMNGDSSKPEIAYAQTYFALQTRRQEKAAARLSEIDQRLDLRERTSSKARVRLTDSGSARKRQVRGFVGAATASACQL